ncbi:MAG: DUF2254 domain-containing protein [Frankiaceae bacterium]|nr:DUF2254 domain-containing protein [Frankiaceae bacterium]
MNRLARLNESIRTGFWAIPAIAVLVALGLALGLVRLDRAHQRDLRYAFGAGPDGAREVLSAITTSMITFTGLVFSITIVVLQLTSSQFSPRVLRTFLRDRQTQLSLGVFVATFVYAVMVLRTVNSSEARFVPAVATTVGMALLLLSVGVFVAYIHHIATAIQVSSIVEAVGREAIRTLEKQIPPGRGRVPGARPALPAPALLVPAASSGVIVSRNDTKLVRLAESADVVLVTEVAIGAFVPEGAPLFAVVGDPAKLDVAAVCRAIHLGVDRTMKQDVDFGIRQLVDIGERALSPGINDPTTAVQALDQLHDILRRLATRSLPDGLHTDEAGTVRLIVPAHTMADFLALGLREIAQYGRDAIQVRDRLLTLLSDVTAAAVPEHRAALTTFDLELG